MNFAAIGVLAAAFAVAQDMDMNPAGRSLMNLASGTAANPEASPMPMIMSHWGGWTEMFMGTAFVIDTQQTGPRGGDKFYSANWFMGSFQHPAGANGTFQFDLMLSLDPATITNRSYPLLFQTGETAYGRPLVDAQHPHDFIMSLGFHYARQLGENTVFTAYFAPVGDPALGPVAFPHRASASELPEATLSHHLQDSTHIADEVVTVGISHKMVTLEASGFYGSEPNENRWNIDSGPINSWSTRLWFIPSENWAAQVSVGRLAHPEALEAGDQIRSTASLHYSKGGWASSFLWGRNHSPANQSNTNSYLVESVRPIARKNFITGRFELVDKNELYGIPAGTYRIGAYTIGYTRDIALLTHVQTGVGANFTAYTTPDSIKPYYGDHPLGGNVFLRFRLK